MEYPSHRSLKIGKIFKIKFVGLAIANSRILLSCDDDTSSNSGYHIKEIYNVTTRQSNNPK